ncbi:MAG: synthase, Delta/Epsilon chain, beta-sandwich domain [Candidatus Parcubacteria bacterium]|jgi:F-type H+-transporting ATPase subunit epsilon
MLYHLYMQAIVARVHENLFQGDVISLTAPTTAGQITVLGNHEPLVVTLKPGVLTVTTKEGEQKFDVMSGVLETSHNQVTVLL